MKTHNNLLPFRKQLIARRLIILSLFVFLSCRLMAGEKVNEWVLSTSVNNVDCYYKIVNCHGDDFVLLKFENKNEREVTVSWNESFYTKEANEKRKGMNDAKQLVIAPGVTSQDDCEKITNKECIISSVEITPTYHPTVIEFYFESIAVK